MPRSLSVLFFLIIISISSAAQQRISGRVTHAQTGEALAGVNILIPDTRLGAVSDTDGTYEIILPEGRDKLLFSFMGMITKEITVGEESVIDIALEPDLLEMEGIVVTAIGIPRAQKALGYSVQELPGQELTLVQRDNFVNSMTGRVAGVNITSTSGSAGASSYITIRGATSIDGNNQPLFVVDGVPISNAAEYQVFDGVDMSNRAMDISPYDIETVSILKGGAATALYGMRAANGAVVITTRKARATQDHKLSTTFLTSLTFNKVSQLPPIQDRYGQGYLGNWISGVPVSWGPRLDTCSYSRQEEDWLFPEYDVDGAVVGMNDPNATGESVKKYEAQDFFQTGIAQNYALEIAGGGERASFITSASWNNTDGVVPGNRWGRFTLKIAGNADISERFSLFGSANYIRSGGDRLQKGSNTSAVMLGLLRTPATFDNSAGYELQSGEQRNFQHGSGYDNPYWSVKKNTFTDAVDRLIGYAGFNWAPLTWMKIDYRLGIDLYVENWKNTFAEYSTEYPNGYVWLWKKNLRDINSDLLFTFSHQFNEDWSSSFTFGHNIFETYSNSVSADANGLMVPGFYNISNSASISATEYTTHIRRAALYGILDLSWRNMIYATLTGRNEWSTTLPEASNSFFYPSASLSWVFTELKPLNQSKILPFGKLRFSYARIANDAQPYYTSTGYFQLPISAAYTTTGLVFPLLGKSGFTLYNVLGNANLKPEMTSTWEAGIDLRWVNNRIALDLTYFHQLSKDLLLSVPVSGATGYYAMYMNAGRMASEGIEAVLGLRPVSSMDWKWDAVFNFTKITNEVLELAPGVDAITLRGTVSYVGARTGYAYQSFFGYDWLRNEKGQVIINDDPSSPNYGFPMGNYDSLVYEGKVNPDWILGWTNTVKWKDLALSFLLEWKKGGKMLNGTRGSLYYFGNHGDQESREPDDLYVFDGVKMSDGSANDIPVVKGANWHLFGEGSSFTGPDAPYVEDAGWIRLREISLSYSFDDLLPDTSRLGSLSVYIAGHNLLLITKYTGIDPESSTYGSSNVQGIDYYSMPGTKGITAGLKLSF